MTNFFEIGYQLAEKTLHFGNIDNASLVLEQYLESHTFSLDEVG